MHCSIGALSGPRLGFHGDYYYCYWCLHRSVRQFRVSHAMRSAPNLQPSPVHLMGPATLEVFSTIFRFTVAFFVHLWHPSDPSRSQEMKQNAVSSSQALELARALIPQDSATDCVVLIYGQMAISHTWPSMCLASVEFASYNKS